MSKSLLTQNEQVEKQDFKLGYMKALYDIQGDKIGEAQAAVRATFAWDEIKGDLR